MRTKRILSILLVVAMVVTLLPVTALAHDGKHDKHDHYGEDDGIRVKIEAGDHGQIDSPGSQREPAPGEVWSFTAVPDGGYRFAGWTFNGNEVSGAFSAADNPVLTVSISQRGTWIETHWEGWNLVLGHWDYAEYKAQAVFQALPVYNLSVSVNDTNGGSVSKNPNKTSFYEGDDVTLTATPKSSAWEFTGWTGDATGNTNPLVVDMNSSKNIVANFSAIPKYALDVAIDGNGTVTKNPNNSTYLRGTNVTLTASPAEGWQFSGWSGDASGTGLSTTVNMNSKKDVKATFTPLPTYELTTGVNVSGSGSVSKNPDWASYYQGKSVSLTASAATGWRFDSWSGDASGTSNPVTVNMNDDKTVTANFTQQFYITLNDPDGGHYDDEGVIERWHDVNSTINLGDADPDPDFASTNIFIGWKDDITGQMVSDYKSENYTFTLTGNRSFTAMYGDTEWLDTSSENNSKGYLDNDLDGHYGRGAVVNLNDAQPTAKTGYTFSHWQELKWGDWVDVPLVGDEPIITIGDSNWFRAVFVRDVSTVSFEENGGTPSVPDQTVTYNQKASKPTTVMTKTGHTFVNWYADPACTTLFNFNTKIKADTVIYAKWTANTYYVAYHENGGTGSMANSTHTYGTGSALTANAFSRTGCSFVGWARSADGSVVLGDGATVTDLTTTNGATVDLYAKWNVSGVTVTGYEREYDGTYRGLSVSGAEGATVWYSEGDELHYVSAPPTFKDVTPAGGITVYVKVERAGAATYTTSAVVKITKAALTAKAKDLSKKYYDLVPALEVEYTGFVTGEDEGVITTVAVLGTTCTQASGVGTYPITFTTEPASGNYDIDCQAGTLTVEKADATIDVNGTVVEYDGLSHGATGTATSADGTTDLTSLLHLGSSFTDVPGGTANWTFDGDANHKAASGSVAIVIEQADAVIDVKGTTVTYDGLPHGATGTATSADGTTDLTSLLHLGSSFTDAPGGMADWTFDGDVNHKAASGSVNIVINQAPLNVTADNKTVIYGGSSPMYTVSYDGFITGEDKAVLGGTLAVNSTYAAGSNAGTYPITPSGLTSTNYDISFVPGTLTVNKATLTVTAEDKAVTFLDAAPAYTVKYSGFVAGDTAAKLGGTLAYTCGYVSGSAVGTYPITPSGLTSDNYNITFKGGTLTVNTLMLTVTFQDYNGTSLGTSTVAYGTPAASPANPVREGYTFTGWSTSFDKVTSAMTVTAQYAINTYTVRFFAADGVTPVGTAQTINWDSPAVFPTAPARTGYAFDEWVLTGDNTGYADSLTHVKENINAVASYIRNGYTVTFVDYDGAVIGTDGVLYGRGAEAPVPPTRAGYTFTGWDREFDPVTGNITVTAQYEINRYTVRFLDYDGTEIDSQTVDYNTAAAAPDEPTRDGYTFTGWDAEFDAVTSDLTVTAQYEEIVPVPSEPVPETNNTIPDEPVPSTGGSAFAWWWIAVIVLGAGLLFFLIFFVWKRRRKEEERQ